MGRALEKYRLAWMKDGERLLRSVPDSGRREPARRPVRGDLVERARRRLASGYYQGPALLDLAIRRMIEEVMEPGPAWGRPDDAGARPGRGA